jgi:L-amino acid N-acyltransferase YncA|tara:strand:+ start:438 stop:872 length:435 start_codon:yes stop_codon:yes gene_type:complete
MIRKATVLDISALVLMLDTMHKETEIEVPKINTVKLVDKINQLIHTGLVLVSVKDNKIQGSIAGLMSQDWWSEEKYIADAWFYVFKDQRKSDVAKNLLQDYIKMSKDAKVKIRLGHIFSGDLERKDNLFKRLGFVKAGSIFVEA